MFSDQIGKLASRLTNVQSIAKVASNATYEEAVGARESVSNMEDVCWLGPVSEVVLVMKGLE